jgi:3-oxoacyl-[acyl-carrier protein] reductase
MSQNQAPGIPRRVLITGASRGIGQAIAQQYIQAGYEVVTPSRSELDLASDASILDYFSAQKNLQFDILINNAAENRIQTIQDLTLEAWQRMLMINLTAPFLLTKFVTSYMAAQGWGRIVSISSCYSLVSRIGRAAYSATKSGINAFTRTAALEFAGQGILVNAVGPGFVETDLTRQNNSPEQIEALRSQIPVGRLGNPEEVANLVFFLGSEQNSYITGQIVLIDGGFLAQ